MRHDARGRHQGAVLGEVLPGRHVIHPVRRGSRVPIPVGGRVQGIEDVRVPGDAGVYRHRAGRSLVRLEKRRAGLGRKSSRGTTTARDPRLAPPHGHTSDSGRRRREQGVSMPWDTAVTDLAQLQDRPELARLIAWNRGAVEGAKFDRNELSITVRREHIREACAILRDTPDLRFNFLSDLTAADYYP